MRNPELMPEVSTHDKVDAIVIENLADFDCNEFDLTDDKDFKKYIIQIKRVIRGSFEYRRLIKFLKDNLDMTECAVYERVNSDEGYNVSIEIHHQPFTLEDIIMTVYNKRMATVEDLSVEAVADEVMRIHYEMSVGLIPLSKTIHELVHNNHIFIPVHKVFGIYKEFVDKYRPYMSIELIELYEKNVEISEQCADILLAQKNLLAVNHMTVQVLDYENPSLEDVLNEIKEIRSNLYNI